MSVASMLPPPPPARLARGDVAASQRARMLYAMAEVAAEKGYARTVVADVVGRAGVSRKTFYEHFADREACFLAAYDACVDGMVVALTEQMERDDVTAEAQLDGIMRVYLQLLADAPLLAKTYLVEVYAAGPDALYRRRQVLQRFVELLRTLHARLKADGAKVRRVDDLQLEALVGAVSMIVTVRVGTGDAATLPALRSQLVRFVLENLLRA